MVINGMYIFNKYHLSDQKIIIKNTIKKKVLLINLEMNGSKII